MGRGKKRKKTKSKDKNGGQGANTEKKKKKKKYNENQNQNQNKLRTNYNSNNESESADLSSRGSTTPPGVDLISGDCGKSQSVTSQSDGAAQSDTSSRGNSSGNADDGISEDNVIEIGSEFMTSQQSVDILNDCSTLLLHKKKQQSDHERQERLKEEIKKKLDVRLACLWNMHQNMLQAENGQQLWVSTARVLLIAYHFATRHPKQHQKHFKCLHPNAAFNDETMKNYFSETLENLTTLVKQRHGPKKMRKDPQVQAWWVDVPLMYHIMSYILES